MKFNQLENINTEEKFAIVSSYVPNIKRVSKTNQDIKHIRSVIKGKTDIIEAVVSGISMIESVTDSSIKINTVVVCVDDIYTQRAQKALYEASKRADNIYAVTSSVFSFLGVKKNSNGLAALITKKYKNISDIKKDNIYIVLDSLELPGNIGTIMRTADGAGLSSIIITNSKVRLNNSTLLAASRAAFAHIDIIVDEVDSIAAWAQENDVDIFLADTRAQHTHVKANFSKTVCFVLGCERYGIDEKWYEKKHRLLKIPMLGKCDSLNVGVAGSILIYEALRQKTVKECIQ